jgi:hypothetical protein
MCYSMFKLIKDYTSNTSLIEYMGVYMFRPLIRLSSGLLLSKVTKCCVYVGIPTLFTNIASISMLQVIT